MAVTKLMNIKSSPRGAGRHLYNSIRYIINPEKTKDGLLVGGNAGTEANEIYNTMQNTKRDWNKTDGRQGYHFVLSWKPGEVEPEKAFELIREFCQEYLGDHYDYVFSVHDDQEHVHGHIVFNSVSRTTGYKYRYEKGDWEKYIQPITDKICERHGLSRLEYDRENKTGKSYAEHYAEKEGKYTWKKIIQADIDYIVSCSDSWTDFLSQMQQIGYTFPRQGVKKGIGEYITFCAPGGHRRRSDSLGPGYSVSDIKKRIAGRQPGEPEPTSYSYLRSPRMKSWKMNSYSLIKTNRITSWQSRYVKKYVRVCRYISWNNPYAVRGAEVRKNLLQIERLREDCHYLLKNNIRSEKELEQREEELKREERYLKSRRSELELANEDETVREYLELKDKLSKVKDSEDDSFEVIQDRMEELEEKLPQGIGDLLKGSDEADHRLDEVRAEKRILRHIRKSIVEPELKISKMTGRKNVREKYLQRTKKAGGEKTWRRR